MLSATVSTKGARRWSEGHPWIYRSDVIDRPAGDAGAVRVSDQRGKPLGVALWSPRSEISLRLLDRDPRREHQYSVVARCNRTRGQPPRRTRARDKRIPARAQ